MTFKISTYYLKKKDSIWPSIDKRFIDHVAAYKTEFKVFVWFQNRLVA